MNSFTTTLKNGISPKNILFGIMGATMLFLPLSVLLMLNRGLDVSDTGHYYVSLYYWSDITMMSVQFPLVWNILPHPDNILINRFLVFILLTGSNALLFVQLGKAVLAPENFTKGQGWFLASASAGGSALFYYYWLPDPSYNSVGLILMAFILGAVCTAARIENMQSWPFRMTAMLAGFAGLGLATTRPVTALILVLISAAVYFLLAKPSWQRLINMVVFALLGALLFFILVQVFIEPLSITLERVRGGLQKREILGIQRLVGLSYEYAREEFRTALHTAPWAMILASFGGALAAPGITERLAKPQWFRLGGALVGSIGLIWMQTIFWSQTHGLAQAPLNLISYYVLNLGLVAIALTILCAIFAADRSWRVQYLRLAALCALLVLATQSFSLLGTGLWVTNAAMAAAFTVLACVLVALFLAKGPGLLWTTAMFSALVLPMLATRTAMVENPYRLETPLRGQVQPTKIRGGHSVIRTDAITKEFFDRLSAVSEQMGPVEQRPILIDLSGRMPMVQYHLQARPAYTAWLLSAYEGSDAFLATIIERMSDEELARAWILDAPGYEYRLDPAPIIARGHALDRDYKVVTSAFAPYIKTDIVLLAPVSRLTTQSPAE